MRTRSSCTSATVAALASATLWACSRGRSSGRPERLGFTVCGDSASGASKGRWLRGSPVGLGAGAEAPAPKLWTLAIRASDHYVWDDEALFTSIVADTGEWEVKVDCIQDAFREAKSSGSAEVFSAPLYVIRDYVQELQNYGLVAEAVPARQAAPEAAGEAAWRQKNYQELSPDVKESLGPMREAAEASSEGPKASVVIFKSDHPSLVGGKTATARFRAYVEMGADAAGRFCPDEGTLNACFNRIAGPTGKSKVFTGFSPEQAEKAVAQLRKAGFVAEVEMAQVDPPTKSPPPAGAGAGAAGTLEGPPPVLPAGSGRKGEGGLRALLLGD